MLRTLTKKNKRKKKEVRRKLNLICLFKKPQQFAINLRRIFTMSANTNQSQDDMNALNKLFDICDSIITGQVKANDLIEKVREEWSRGNDNERESKVHINDLVQRLDPRKDNW